MTQELIANMLGVRREGVTEAAGKLQVDGVIQYSRGHIKVLARGEFAKKLTVRAHKFSSTAAEKIAAAGGVAEVIAG